MRQLGSLPRTSVVVVLTPPRWGVRLWLDVPYTPHPDDLYMHQWRSTGTDEQLCWLAFRTDAGCEYVVMRSNRPCSAVHRIRLPQTGSATCTYDNVRLCIEVRPAPHVPMMSAPCVRTNLVRSRGAVETLRRAGNRSALVWLPGRVDCFMHPHVADRVLYAGFDVYVCHYHGSPVAYRCGLVTSLSEVSSASDPELRECVEGLAETLSQTREYDRVVGYAHSTGAVVLGRYLLAYGDDAFDGFYLNAPFLDWGHVPAVTYQVLRRLPQLRRLVPVPDATVFRRGGRFNAWLARTYSLYRFDPRDRLDFVTAPVTAGFICAASRFFADLAARRTLTQKPLAMAISRSDDVLPAASVLERVHWFGGNVLSVHTPAHAAHDVFLSPRYRDTEEAIRHLCDFLSGIKTQTHTEENPPQ